MPYISEITIRLRFKTCEIVDTLLEEGKASNQKSALEFILKRANKLTGFSGQKDKIYYQYIMFRRTHYNRENENENEFEY